MHSNLNLLLHQNLCHTSPSPSSSTKPWSPRGSERRRDYTEYGTIQKDGFQRTMGAADITGLLSSIRNNISCPCCQRILHAISCLRFGCIIFFADVKLVSKPISVLLEDERSKTSSEGHDQTVLAFLKLTCSTSTVNS